MRGGRRSTTRRSRNVSPVGWVMFGPQPESTREVVPRRPVVKPIRAAQRRHQEGAILWAHPRSPQLSVPLRNNTVAEDLTQPIAEQDVKPTDKGDGMDFPEKSLLEFPDASNFIHGDGGTISLDIEPHWTVADEGINNNAFVEVKTPG